MNSKAKGVLQILLVVILIAAFAVIAYRGIGGAHRGSAKNIRLGLDLRGGVSVTYEAVKDNPTAEEMQDTVYKMQKRVENFSTEASVYQEGDNRVTIDIPGVSNSAEILDKLGQAGALQFILYENLKDKDGNPNPKEGDEVTFDEKNVELDGSMLQDARATRRQQEGTGVAENVVQIKFTGKGTKKFAKVTGEHVGDQLAIVYDNVLVSAPVLRSEITDGEAVIEGGFKEFSDAEELASTLRIGALPLELRNIHDNVVGATLGSEALESSLLAGLIGFILIIIFMIVMYRLPGVSAAIALVFYVGAMLLILNGLNVTLTLPGIAGIILSVGMAVDANCIIFSRIREELATGKTVSSSIKNGFSKALSAIIDGNVTTLIAAFVLYLRGSGTVKGFAQTLAIGIVLSMFTAIFVTRLLMKAFCSLGLDDVKLYGVTKERKTINFIGHWKKYVAISGTIVVICIGGLIFNATVKGEALNYSLDFVGGTSTSVSIDEQTEITDELKENVLTVVKDATGLDGEVSTSDDKGVKKITVRTTALTEEQAEAVRSQLAENFHVEQDQVESETISASVSNEMKTDAVVATLIAIVCMLIYIWIRFRNITTGASAVIALIHDVIVVFTVYVVASAAIQVGSTFIACILTIVGYSINDTIVVFDRIRENRKTASARTELSEIVNKSITETLSRSINTSVTTFIMIFMLALLGVSSVRQFAIPLIVGIIAGCYSSICVASPVWYLFMKNSKKEKRAVTYSKKKK
ncbi:MAG: protein translocase subunit SecD [Lachnospiraceae bacterium]|nr:protein translocase subunit SecD [Lachnospiraceae bacterium]